MRSDLAINQKSMVHQLDHGDGWAGCRWSIMANLKAKVAVTQDKRNNSRAQLETLHFYSALFMY
jgi:hypothetical protein